jgi:hypothetical protein
MIYRVLQRLSVGRSLAGYLEPGSTVSSERLGYRVAQILEAKGAISPISAPPLDVLPGWKLRAERFAEHGYDALALLEGDDEMIANDTSYNVKSIARWKQELRDYLLLGKSKEVKGCKNC